MSLPHLQSVQEIAAYHFLSEKNVMAFLASPPLHVRVGHRDYQVGKVDYLYDEIILHPKKDSQSTETSSLRLSANGFFSEIHTNCNALVLKNQQISFQVIFDELNSQVTRLSEKRFGVLGFNNTQICDQIRKIMMPKVLLKRAITFLCETSLIAMEIVSFNEKELQMIGYSVSRKFHFNVSLDDYIGRITKYENYELAADPTPQVQVA